jgi:beta propeller repeat protein
LAYWINHSFLDFSGVIQPATLIDIMISTRTTLQLARYIVVFFIIFAVMHFLIANNHRIEMNTGLNPVFPVIEGDLVVYENRADWNHADIIAMNLSTGNTSTLSNTDGIEYRPDISNGTAVWQRKTTGDWNIFGCDLKSGKIFPVSVGPSRKTTPRISGDRVVFVDDKSGSPDIMMVNLTTGGEMVICNQSDVQWQPDIDGNWIVWEDWRDGAESRGDIMAYDILTGREVQVTRTPWADWFPAVSGEWVVWQSQERGNFDIYAKNLTTGRKIEITTDPSRQWLPRISIDSIVWIDERNGNWDIHGYNLSNLKELRLSDGPDNDGWPDVDNGTVTYITYMKKELPILQTTRFPAGIE